MILCSLGARKAIGAGHEHQTADGRQEFSGSALSAAVIRGFSALRTLFLAKLLLPADFGLVAVAFLAINSLELFRELGFSSALVVRRKDLDEAADTANVTILVSSFPALFGGARCCRANYATDQQRC